jgi:predicted small lipoprotein YifL
MQFSVHRFNFVLLAICLALAGCGDKNPAPSADVAPDSQAAAASAPENVAGASEKETFAVPDAGKVIRDQAAVPAKITAIRLSESGDSEHGTIGLPKTVFSPTDTIFAEIATDGTAAGYTVYARWISDEGMVLSEYGVNVADPGKQTRVISLSKPDGWPKGIMKLEASINSQPIKTVEFKVQ